MCKKEEKEGEEMILTQHMRFVAGLVVIFITLIGSAISIEFEYSRHGKVRLVKKKEEVLV